MTREEAIRLIGWLKCTTNREDDLEAIDMAIKALSQPIVCKDYCINDDHIYCSPKVADRVIEALQTDLVRCKDCRHRDLFSCPLADNDFQKDEDFCSWGERKKESEEEE